MNPVSVVVGDFNGDGKPDLAVANAGSNNVSVLLGIGDGTFQPALNFNAGARPSSLITGDFNSDGRLDLIVANEGSNNVSVLLGDGNGNFQPALNFNAGAQPQFLVAGDFSGDGRPDLAVANAGSNNVSILMGNGDGTFQPALNFNAGSGPQSIAVSDFNRDGKPDLAVASGSSNNISLLLGNGDGTFQPGLNVIVTGSFSFQLVTLLAGDFNGDGKADLAAGTSFNVSILLGNGDGTFQPARSFQEGFRALSLAAGDFNADGKLDLAVARQATFSNSVGVLLGNGDGTFLPPVDVADGIQPVFLTARDFNGDGGLDIAVVTRSGVSLLINNVAGSGGSAVTTVSAASGGPGLTPESVASAYGPGLASVTQSATSLPLPTFLGGVTVQVRDSAGAARSAPLFYVSPTQINFEIPAGTALGAATISVINSGTVLSGPAQIQNIAPALFSANATGRGVAAAVAVRVGVDGVQTTFPVFQCSGGSGCVSVPIDLGVDTPVYLSLFGTGIRNRSSLSAVRCTINGIDVPVLYAGPQGAFVGVDQINVALTLNLRNSGETDLVLTVDGRAANTVRINIQ